MKKNGANGIFLGVIAIIVIIGFVLVNIVKSRISAVGDVTLGVNQKQDYKGSFDEYYDLNGADYFLSNVTGIFNADDFTIVNLEGVLTDSDNIRTTKEWNMRGRPEYAKIFGVDDFAAAFVRLEGDIILDFRISWAMHMDTPGDTLILGTEGGLRIPSTDCWNGTIGGDLILYHTVGSEQVQTVIPRINPEERTPCFEMKVRSFLDAIHTGGKAPIPTSEIIYNQAIIDHIVKSAKLGHEIPVEIPEI